MAARMSPRLPRRDHRTGWSAAVAIAVVTLVATACSTGGGSPVTYPPVSARPDLDVSPAVIQTRGLVAAALDDVGLTLRDVETPYRPAEAPMLASAPRAVYQVLLQESPDKGFIVIYEFRDIAVAAQAATEHAAYLASGPGRIQWPLGAHHVIRGVGTTVIVYSWLPGAADDPKTPDIESALETVGAPFQVPG